jgi:hypothetical protein
LLAAAVTLSLPWLVVIVGALVAAVVLELVVVEGGRFRDATWRGAYVMFELDLFAAFLVLTAWHPLGADPALGLALAAALVGAAALGHRFRHRILQELHAPSTRLGVVLTGFLGIGGGSAAALGMAAGRDVPLPVLSGVLVVVALYIVLAVHARWLHVEDPTWTPAEPRRARRRARPARG